MFDLPLEKKWELYLSKQKVILMILNRQCIGIIYHTFLTLRKIKLFKCVNAELKSFDQ